MCNPLDPEIVDKIEEDKFLEEYKRLCRTHKKTIAFCMICESIRVNDLEEGSFKGNVFEVCKCKRWKHTWEGVEKRQKKVNDFNKLSDYPEGVKR
ncbi:hypothetical protein LCGC14_1198400 [marine sediment metagenome]|uniref:Uncharacterized protein n=1 Tax=marine sediment metagenome TaxID=412755 RepID=A0A0F9LHM2_9ZZZZ